MVKIIKNTKRGSVFLSIIAIIGAVLIFVGVAWLIAKNWHQIPDMLKVMILVFSTLAAFVSGVLFRQGDHEGTGRSLITLGALLYILSLFLISQIYNLATTSQHYAWLLFLAWTVIILTAYLLYSPENLVISMIVFFPWVILQYYSSILDTNLNRNSIFSNVNEGGVIFGLIFIFLSAGSLLYGLSVFHNSIKHKFTNLYRYWTVFYFLLIFYILSFQFILPMLSEYSFEGETFTLFLVSFIILCFIGFIVGTLLAVSKNTLSIKEILGVIGVIAILFLLILSTKAGAGLIGRCYPKSCYDFKTSSTCISASDPLVCEWKPSEGRREGYCQQISCYNFRNESECNSAPSKLNCIWENNYCRDQIDTSNKDIYQKCAEYNNKKDSCLDTDACNWRPNYNTWVEKLPTSLWLLWIIINFVFIGFILLVLWYGQYIGSTKIINLGLIFFILEIITRYIGFWLDFEGYFAFSILAILGGIMLILASWLIPKWRRNLLEEIHQNQ